MKQKGYIYAAAIIIVALLIAYLLGCNHGKHLACPVNKDTASIKHDTVIVVSNSDTIYVPKLETIIQYKPVIINTTDTLFLETFQPVDTAAILKDYFATRFYSDSQNVANGYILIKDSVRENKIASRRFISHFSILHDSVTVTLRQPKRSLFYAGVGVMGNNEGSILKGVSGSLGFKSKNDLIYEISISAIQYNKPLYQGWLKVPLRFGKK